MSLLNVGSVHRIICNEWVRVLHPRASGFHFMCHHLAKLCDCLISIIFEYIWWMMLHYLITNWFVGVFPGPGNPKKLGLPKIKQQEKPHPLDAALPLALAARGLVGLSSRSSDVGGICPQYSQTWWLLLEPLQQGKDRSQGMNKQTEKQETHTLLWIAWIILNLNRTAASSANCRLVENKHSETCMQIKPRKEKIIEVAKNNQEQDWTNLPKSIQDQDCTHKQGNGETSTSGNRKQSSSIVIDSRFLEGPFDSWCVQER